MNSPDPSGLAFIRDGRGLQRQLLSWLYAVRTELGTHGWDLPFESGHGLVPHWRGSTSWVTDSALTLSQLLQHPAVEDDLILTQVIREISGKITSLLRKISKKQQEKHFQQYQYSLASLGAVCALFLAWSEVPVLTTDILIAADLETPLRSLLGNTESDGTKVLQVCEVGRRQLLHQLKTEGQAGPF